MGVETLYDVAQSVKQIEKKSRGSEPLDEEMLIRAIGKQIPWKTFSLDLVIR